MNVLIVDDEVIIRTGLASVISWSELGLNLLQPAASAEEALERLEVERPDILITDIRMNGKTGLELAEEAVRRLPGLEVIILSGYGDFAYAQQAIRQGVSDYLLKTSKPEEIIRTVLQAKQRLVERRAEDSRAHRQAREERQRQLYKWVIEGEAGAAPADPKHAGSSQDLKNFGHPWYRQVLILSAGGWGQEEEADSLLRFAVQNMLEDLLPGAAVLIHQRRIVCVTGPEPSAVHSSGQRFKGMLERIENLLNCQLRLAAGVPVEDPDQVHQSYVTAQAAFAYHDLLPGAKLLDYQAFADRKGGKTVITQEEENELGSILLEQDRMALRAWTHRLADELTADPECTPESYQACLQSAAVAAHRWLERTLRALGKEGAARFAPWLQQHIGGAKLKDELFRHLHAVMSLYHGQLGEGQASHVQRAKAYMESCPAEELSLQQVAAYVHLHPSHLSELFKKETGSTFGDYVTALRMRRAMELLAVSPAKVSEIAGLTGYEDVKYFSRLFKKHTGKTPSEFREEAPGGTIRQA
ncbi:response regulator [Paenibacillus sp. p3-SID1389]|uniref:helix-turn-helix domain-containing protein n=1 Tax=Paenibacillus sp. p3-SID1389 TaxID=2916364 RepID=UPI0021A8E307|nr:helix-turn-helix domain-containing protein [Paenibacillus sp. p3-SID1389]MCT2196383.1 response regulator [Paenibacillus sp. p3-SID1389]